MLQTSTVRCVCLQFKFSLGYPVKTRRWLNRNDWKEVQIVALKTRQLAKCNKANKQAQRSQERTQEERGWKEGQTEEYTVWRQQQNHRKSQRDCFRREYSTAQPSRKFPCRIRICKMCKRLASAILSWKKWTSWSPLRDEMRSNEEESERCEGHWLSSISCWMRDWLDTAETGSDGALAPQGCCEKKAVQYIYCEYS